MTGGFSRQHHPRCHALRRIDLTTWTRSPRNRIVAVLDCPEAVDLSEFYGTESEWEVVRPGPDAPDALHPEWVPVRPPDASEVGFSLGFQRVDNYRAPVWSERPVPQQAHLEFWVKDNPEAKRTAVALGVSRHAVQPGEADREGFVVFLDPVGHSFCLCRS